MPQRVRLPDGSIAEFPDGVPPEDIERAIRQRFEQDQPATPAAPPTMRDRLEAYSGSFLHGATFGWLDEIAAGIRSIISGKPYDQTLDEEQKRLERLKLQFPESRAFELGGAVASPVNAVLPGAAAGAPLATRIGMGALQGGLAGVAAGVGSARPGQRIGTGVLSGLTGAAVGGAAPAVVNALRPAATYMLDFTNLRTPMSKTGLVASPRERALNLVNDYTAMDEVNLPNLRSQILNAQQLGKPFVVADAAGDNVRNLLDTALSQPSKGANVAKSFLQNRATTEGRRLANDILNISGGFESSISRARQFEIQRAARFHPNFEKLLDDMTGKPIDDPDLLKLLNRPIGKRLFGKAIELARNEGRPVPIKYDAEGNPVGVLPDLRLVDYVRKAAQDFIWVGKRTGSAGKEEREIVHNFERELLETVDKIVPQYGQLRSAYAHELKIIDALKAGEELAKKVNKPEELAWILDRYDPSVAPYVVEGAKSALYNDVKGIERGIPTKFLAGTPAKRESLQKLFGQQYRDLEEAVELEKKMRSTMISALGNSKTAQRLAHQEALGAENPVAFTSLGGVVGDFLRRQRLPIIRRNADIFADILANPQTAPSVADELLRLRKEKALRDAMVSHGAGRFGAGVGLLFGGNR